MLTDTERALTGYPRCTCGRWMLDEPVWGVGGWGADGWCGKCREHRVLLSAVSEFWSVRAGRWVAHQRALDRAGLELMEPESRCGGWIWPTVGEIEEWTAEVESLDSSEHGQRIGQLNVCILTAKLFMADLYDEEHDRWMADHILGRRR